jgi:hypothetical protein
MHCDGAKSEPRVQAHPPGPPHHGPTPGAGVPGAASAPQTATGSAVHSSTSRRACQRARPGVPAGRGGQWHHDGSCGRVAQVSGTRAGSSISRHHGATDHATEPRHQLHCMIVVHYGSLFFAGPHVNSGRGSSGTNFEVSAQSPPHLSASWKSNTQSLPGSAQGVPQHWP